MKQLALVLFMAACACAQPIGFGVKAGVPLNDAIRTIQDREDLTFSDLNTGRYIIGGMAELRLPFGLAVEADALYQTFEAEAGALRPGLGSSASISGSQWQFPIVAKYRLGGIPLVRPYVEGGLAFSRLTDVRSTVTRLVNPSTNTQVNAPVDRNSRGLVLGGGVEIRALFLRISPEVRYIRWGDDYLNPSDLLRFNRNQAQFLVGFSF